MSTETKWARITNPWNWTLNCWLITSFGGWLRRCEKRTCFISATPQARIVDRRPQSARLVHRAPISYATLISSMHSLIIVLHKSAVCDGKKIGETSPSHRRPVTALPRYANLHTVSIQVYQVFISFPLILFCRFLFLYQTKDNISLSFWWLSQRSLAIRICSVLFLFVLRSGGVFSPPTVDAHLKLSLWERDNKIRVKGCQNWRLFIAGWDASSCRNAFWQYFLLYSFASFVWVRFVSHRIILLVKNWSRIRASRRNSATKRKRRKICGKRKTSRQSPSLPH